jgi:hypothetical protein
VKAFSRGLAAYYLIGLIVTLCIWFCDETSSATDILGIPCLAPFWPILFYLILKT